MNLAAVYHEAKSKYAYMFDRKTSHLRMRTARGDVPSVTLVGGDPFRWIQSKDDPTHWEWDKTAAFFEPMQVEYQTTLHDYWFVAIQPQWKRLRYAFILQKEDQKVLYGSRSFYDLREQPEAQYETSYFFNFPYLNHEDLFHPPGWVKNTIWYQIFPERYADGDTGNNPENSLPWGSEEDTIYKFYGGDLQGVIDHLDELVELGINGIYFTPIFESPSSHKYDTTNYYKIDPAFGTNELFGELMEKAHQRGIRVMLDAVFNHCGWFHPFWQDVVKHGRESKYYDCFFIEREPVINFEVEEGKIPKVSFDERGHLNYATFAFTPLMPKWNTDHPLVKEHLFGAIRYWTETYRVDGWRLDVSNEVPHAFWREFRQMLKHINPEIYILGENWDNSYPWLMGDQFDGVMNYELTYPIWFLLGEPDRVKQKYDVVEYQEAINQLLANYPKHNLPVMYNLIDSHDTPRIMSICGDNVDKVKLAYLLQFTFAGAPSVYYGSEVGLAGPEGHNRRCMPWEASQQDKDIRSFVKNLIRLRKRYSVFGEVNLKWLLVDSENQAFIFQKNEDHQRLIVVVNTKADAVTLKIPDELKNKKYKDLFADREIALNEELQLNKFEFRLLLG
ncbi:MAG: glycoside hydrolase family 13 protein [Anaerolineaceae bacterium]|nr:glycoside hydrolase family 13 protein [Anaerolineaceae bacterium]